MSLDSLEDELLQVHDHIYSHVTGKLFGDVGYSIGLGLVMLSPTWMPYTFALILPAVYVMLSRSGIKIDLERNRIQEFTRHFGIIETGRWKENTRYHELAILGGTSSVTAHVGLARAGRFSSNKIYVALLDKFHYKRIEIFEARNVPEAKKVARLISERTGFPLVDFQPLKTGERRIK